MRPRPPLRLPIAVEFPASGEMFAIGGSHIASTSMRAVLCKAWRTVPKPPPMRVSIIRELIEAGATLDALAHHEESIAAYSEVDARFGAEPDSGIADLVAIALIRKGQQLSKLRRREESIAIFDEVVSRYQAAEDPRFRIGSPPRCSTPESISRC